MRLPPLDPVKPGRLKEDGVTDRWEIGVQHKPSDRTGRVGSAPTGPVARSLLRLWRVQLRRAADCVIAGTPHSVTGKFQRRSCGTGKGGIEQRA